MTYGELVYMIMDELKVLSDDSYFNEDHIIFLADKYRVFLLKQKYSDIKKQMPDSNYQTICLNLKEENIINSSGCESLGYLKSIEKIPHMMKVSSPKLSPINYFNGIMMSFVSRERLQYVGNNRFTSNFIFASIGDDNHLYLKSSNPQYSYLEKVKLTGVFEDSREASKLRCLNEDNSNCSILEQDFPIESSLVNPLIELIVKELLPAVYRPEDNNNDSKDNLSELGVTKPKKNA